VKKKYFAASFAISPYLVLAVGILAVSTASPMIRYAQREAPSIVIAAYRMVLAAMLLAPLGIGKRLPEIKALPGKQLALVGLGGFLLACHFASWITSLEFTTVSSSVVLVTTTPLWVALLSSLLLKEKLSQPVKIGLGIALLGSTVVGMNEACQYVPTGIHCPPFSSFIQGKVFWGNFLALMGAWLAAGYLIGGRILRNSLSLVAYTSLVYGAAAIVLLLWVWASGERMTGFSVQTYGWFLGLALFPQLLGHSSFNWALRVLSVAYVSIALLGEPVGSSILAMILLREIPSGMEIFGGVLILTGILIASRFDSGVKTPVRRYDTDF